MKRAARNQTAAIAANLRILIARSPTKARARVKARTSAREKERAREKAKAREIARNNQTQRERCRMHYLSSYITDL